MLATLFYSGTCFVMASRPVPFASSIATLFRGRGGSNMYKGLTEYIWPGLFFAFGSLTLGNFVLKQASKAIMQNLHEFGNKKCFEF
jgi:hypothetical protein